MGEVPPTRLPDAVVAAIRTVEKRAQRAGPSALAARRWTLTWLEGRPYIELDPAEGSDEFTVIRYSLNDDTATIATGDSVEEQVEDEL